MGKEKNKKRSPKGPLFKGTLVFPRRGKTAGFRLCSSAIRAESMPASAFIPPFAQRPIVLRFLFFLKKMGFKEVAFVRKPCLLQPSYHLNRLFRWIGVMVLFLLMCGCAGKGPEQPMTDLADVSWPIFRGDSALTGIAVDPVADELTLLWSFDTEAYIISSPVIGFETVYIGSTDGKLYALDLITGREIWTFDTGDDIEASPLLLDESVYIGNLSGDFFCLSALGGQENWQFKCGSSIYGSANWVKGQKGGDDRILVGSYDYKMYCLDVGSGELVWDYETDNFINGAPATDGQHVVFGGCDETLHILSVSDGTREGGVWAGSYIPGSAAIADSTAYLGHYDNQLVAIDLIGQQLIWTYQDRDHPGPFFSSPAVTKDYVLAGSRDGYLHCVSRTSGQKIWEFQTFNEIDGSPVVAGEKVIFGSIDGRLYMLDLKSGEKIWSYEIGAALSGCPAVAGGFVIIGAEDGRVYLFGEQK